MPRVEPLLEELRQSGQFRIRDTPAQFDFPGLSEGQANLIFWVGIGLLVLLIGLMVWQLLPVLRPASRNLAAERPLPAQTDASWQQWTRVAQELTLRSDYRGACRAWYLTLLLWLDQQQQVRYQPTRTNFEYLQDLEPYAHLSAPLTRLIQTYERLWYGNQTGTVQDVRQCQEAVEEARNSLRT
ncbi:DUF4129 domain-containing protein [Anthocerotibacter panamensis]|uniref:DUF4129 domain-containing protein n=1 Tax=Anthocerotibacter panamensis TaxID=2857077 RepID=UPI001C405021|nr:DUF4129 domain-containing protein [Anthocerotibacter panamensis]